MESAKSFQSKAIEVIDAEEGVVGESRVSSKEWFDACRHLIGILRKAANSPDSAIAHSIKDCRVELRTLSPNSYSLPLEAISVIDRELLLASLNTLLENIEVWALALKERKVLTTGLKVDRKPLPSSLKYLTKGLLAIERKKRKSRTAILPKPRPKEEVLKMWEQFKNKHGIE